MTHKEWLDKNAFGTVKVNDSGKVDTAALKSIPADVVQIVFRDPNFVKNSADDMEKAIPVYEKVRQLVTANQRMLAMAEESALHILGLAESNKVPAKYRKMCQKASDDFMDLVQECRGLLE